MKLEILPHYEPITEKEFCCVPAALQMIQNRRGLAYLTQDEIGWQLGLVVPPSLEDRFERVRIGPEPAAGYGTQTSKDEFSIASYFSRNHLPLLIKKIQPDSSPRFSEVIAAALEEGSDVIICYNSRCLFGDGDTEHVSLIQEIEPTTGELLVIDPAINAPKQRRTTSDALFRVCSQPEATENAGLWIVSSAA